MAVRQEAVYPKSADRVSAIAKSWYQSIAQTAYVPIGLNELQECLHQLAEDALLMFHADRFIEGEARAIGAALVDLHLVQAECLGKSVELLARELPADLTPEQLFAMQSRLSALLGGITQGYFQQATSLILKEQESVRRANVSALNALFNQRQKQQERLVSMHEKLQAQLIEQAQIEQALHASEEQFRVLFEESPVALWALDGSQLYSHLVSLKETGIPDFHAFFNNYPAEVLHCIKLLTPVDINQQALRVTGMAEKDDLLLPPFESLTEDSIEYLADIIVDIADGKTEGSGMATGISPGGRSYAAIYRWSVPVGCQQTYAKVFLSFIDITAQREAEQKLLQIAKRLDALHKIESRILKAESTKAIAEVALEQMEKIVPSTSSGITLIVSTANETIILASRNTQFETGDIVPAAPEEVKVWKEGRPLIINDVAALPEKSTGMEHILQLGGRSLLSIPLLAQEHLIGAFHLIHANPNGFSEQDLQICEEIGNSVAIAIHNAHLLEMEKKAHREAETLRDVAGVISAKMDQEELLDLVLVQLARVLPYDRATILLRSEDKLTMSAHRGIEIDLPEGFIESGQLPRNILRIMQEKRSVIVADTESDPDWLDLPGGEFIRCSLGVPLTTKVDLIGLLLLGKDEPYFYTEEDARLALAFANHAAIAIENANLYREVQLYANNLETLVLERTRELGALYDITAITSRYLELQETFDRITSVIAERLNCAAISIHILDDSGSTLHLIAEKNLTPSMREYLQILPVQQSVLGQVLEDDESIIYRHPPSVSELSDVPLPADTTYGITVPINIKGKDLGVLGLGYVRDDVPTREDVALIYSIADHIGVALENERLRKQSEQLAVLEERDRLARDLHDSATQSLFSLTLFAAAAREHLINGQLDLVEDQLEELQETAIQTHKEMRLLIYELRPKILEDVGLKEALRQRTQLVEFRSGVQSEINADLSTTLPFPVQEVLFQVANEALNNMLKHSGADAVSIDIHMESDQVAMQIKDNGLGFSTDDTDFSAGLGLHIMRERIQAMKGTFHYESQPDIGTTINAKIPLQRDEVPRDS